MTRLLNKTLSKLIKIEPEHLKRFTEKSFDEFLDLCDTVKDGVKENFKEYNLEEAFVDEALSAIMADILLGEQGIEDAIINILDKFVDSLKTLLYSSDVEEISIANQHTTIYKDQAQFFLDLIFNFVLNLKVGDEPTDEEPESD